jgi:DNA-directed RNA polymerase subunit F
VLETNEWAGQYIPIVPVYGDEVNVEGKRHFISLIRFAKDAAQMHNYWRTASTELVALAPKAPYIGKVGAFDTDANKWATANTDVHPYIEYDGDIPPQRQPFSGVPAGALQEAMNASDDMKAIMGLYDASLGAKSNETSGKAILARERQGDTSTFHFIDNMTRAIRQVGRICGDLIPKIYNGERIVRVIGEDESNKMVKINAEYEEKDGTRKLHDLTAGKYDLIVKAGASYTTRRQEAAVQMMELLKSFPDAAPIIGDLVAKNLDWPGADDIAKRLKAMLPPNLQEQEEEGQEIPPQVQQMIQQGQQQIQEMQQALQALTQENEALKKGEMSKAADSQTKAQTERHNMIVDIASKIVLEAMKLAPEKQREAADAATQTMAHLVGEDAQMLNDTVGNLMDVAQGAEMKAASIAEVNPAAPINELKSMLELLIQQTIETKSAITAPRQVVLQEDANGKVVGGTSQIVG